MRIASKAGRLERAGSPAADVRRGRAPSPGYRAVLRAALGGVICVAALAACTGQKTVIAPQPAASEAGPRVWPGPPEVARYAYVGDYLGEQNVHAAETEHPGAIQRGLSAAWRWITGIGQSARERVELQRPQSGVTDELGRVYVTDVSRQAVLVFDVVDGSVKVWETADGQRRFEVPIGIALDGQGHVLVTDAKLGEVFRFERDGTFVGRFGKGLLRRPTGIAVDAEQQHIYVADTDAGDIKVFDEEGSLLDTYGYAGEEPGRFNRPVYLAFAQGRLYVCDALNARIQIFDREGNPTATIGRRGLYIGNLTRPKGVAVDSEGHIYVVEGFYDHLLVFQRDGQFLMSIGGTGQRPGEFYLPAGVWTDAANRIYVADMFNGRVSIFQFLGTKP